MSAGRVCTGFSKPYVAKYNNAGGTVTYSDGMELARGVSVSLNPSAPAENIFYANNGAAESENGVFTGGELKLTVDGLFSKAEEMLYGLPAAEEVTFGEIKAKVTKHSADAKPPYMGVGVIVEYMSDGVTTYEPTVFRKAKFRPHGTEAKTREKEINWQTQDLTADLHRDDTGAHDWKWVAEAQTTEAEAEAILRGMLNVAADQAG